MQWPPPAGVPDEELREILQSRGEAALHGTRSCSTAVTRLIAYT